MNQNINEVEGMHMANIGTPSVRVIMYVFTLFTLCMVLGEDSGLTEIW